MISRRALLAATALAVPSLALVGCNGMSSQQVITTAAQDTAAIAAGLKGALANLGTLNIKGLTPDKVETAEMAVAGLQVTAAALAQASSAAAAQPIVQQVEADVNAVVAALSGITWPPEQKSIATALAAAQVLVPVVESAVGMVVAATQKPATSAAMSPDLARAILLGAAAR